MPDKPFPTVIGRVLVATDRSESADKAVRWAAEMAERYEAELILLQVVLPQDPVGEPDGRLTTGSHEPAVTELQQYAKDVAGERGRARIVIDADPARAIVQAADDAAVDVVVVGNIGMSGRTSFLLGNVPNRVSHNARCHVIIVNTARPVADGRGRIGAIPVTPGVRTEAAPEHEGRLFGRAARIARVLARVGLGELFSSARSGDDAAVRERARKLRGAMEELGPTFAKMGQILSTRPDLLPQAFVEELSTLQDHVPPLSEQEVVKVMEEELGVPWEDVFASIDP